MFAVIRTGGKQYKVAKNDVIRVERLPGEAGESIDLENVLMIADGAKTTVGTPVLEGAAVRACVLGQDRADKVIIFKKKRRQNYRRTRGHRQNITVLKITDIFAKGDTRPKAEKIALKPRWSKSAPAAKTEKAKASAKSAAPKKAEPKKAEPKKAASAKKSESKTAAKKSSAKKKPAAKKEK